MSQRKSHSNKKIHIVLSIRPGLTYFNLKFKMSNHNDIIQITKGVNREEPDIDEMTKTLQALP